MSEPLRLQRRRSAARSVDWSPMFTVDRRALFTVMVARLSIGRGSVETQLEWERRSELADRQPVRLLPALQDEPPGRHVE